jgi:hypothetical protein
VASHPWCSSSLLMVLSNVLEGTEAARRRWWLGKKEQQRSLNVTVDLSTCDLDHVIRHTDPNWRLLDARHFKFPKSLSALHATSNQGLFEFIWG